MKHFLSLSFLLSLCMATVEAAVAASFQELSESRYTVDATQYPFAAIGRLNGAGINRRSHCTATLIDPQHILTAAHCLYFGARKRWFKANELNFLAGYQYGEFVAHGRVAEISHKGDYKPGAKPSRNKQGQDWAILKLTAPIEGIAPLKLISTPAAHVASDVSSLSQAGYHRSRPHVQTQNKGCKIVQQDSELIVHTCALGPGDSGSPLLIVRDEVYNIIGLNISVVKASSGTTQSIAIPSDKFIDLPI